MQQLWATFRRKLEATSNLQLKQIRLAYTPNIYHKQHLLWEGSRFNRITGAISPLVREIKVWAAYKRWQTSDYKEATATAETTRATEARATIVAQYNKQQAY